MALTETIRSIIVWDMTPGNLLDERQWAQSQPRSLSYFSSSIPSFFMCGLPSCYEKNRQTVSGDLPHYASLQSRQPENYPSQIVIHNCNITVRYIRERGSWMNVSKKSQKTQLTVELSHGLKIEEIVNAGFINKRCQFTRSRATKAGGRVRVRFLASFHQFPSSSISELADRSGKKS